MTQYRVVIYDTHPAAVGWGKWINRTSIITDTQAEAERRANLMNRYRDRHNHAYVERL